MNGDRNGGSGISSEKFLSNVKVKKVKKNRTMTSETEKTLDAFGKRHSSGCHKDGRHTKSSRRVVTPTNITPTIVTPTINTPTINTPTIVPPTISAFK